jgi:hypothetical protein
MLESSAEANVQGYRLGGAIAAFAFTGAFLSSVFFNFYRLLAADQLEEYAKQIQELQAKLIKGAPCPPGYTVDVDEKHKLVFARPRHWEPREGILYYYLEEQKPSDDVTANFNVVYVNEKQLAALLGGRFDPSTVNVDDIYEKEMMKLEALTQGTMSKEYVTIDGIKSAKYINTFRATVPTEESPEGKELLFRTAGILTYVPRLKALYVFTCTDNEKDYLTSSEIFNNVISSIRFL